LVLELVLGEGIFVRGAGFYNINSELMTLNKLITSMSFEMLTLCSMVNAFQINFFETQ